MDKKNEMEEGLNQAGASGAGAVPVDPVSAIATAIGDIFSSVGGVIMGKQEKDTAYQEWLNSNPSTFKWFYQRGEKDNTGLIVIGVLAFILVFIVGIVAYLKVKKAA